MPNLKSSSEIRVLWKHRNGTAGGEISNEQILSLQNDNVVRGKWKRVGQREGTKVGVEIGEEIRGEAGLGGFNISLTTRPWSDLCMSVRLVVLAIFYKLMNFQLSKHINIDHEEKSKLARLTFFALLKGSVRLSKAVELPTLQHSSSTSVRKPLKSLDTYSFVWFVPCLSQDLAMEIYSSLIILDNFAWPQE